MFFLFQNSQQRAETQKINRNLVQTQTIARSSDPSPAATRVSLLSTCPDLCDSSVLVSNRTTMVLNPLRIVQVWYKIHVGIFLILSEEI
uniref:Uncharacterized protein n=1 Tax=Solanum tuberosum TaxID=4113 RepID=M1CS44_SOLTU